MRVLYIGMDNRTRVAEANRIKFVTDSYKDTDNANENTELTHGPAIVVHVNRLKGGKRLMMAVPDGANLAEVEAQLLEKGWADLSAFPVKGEFLY